MGGYIGTGALTQLGRAIALVARRKGKVKMNAAEGNPTTGSAIAPSIIGNSHRLGCSDDRRNCVATAAYPTTGPKSGFPAKDLDDWLEGEAELDGRKHCVRNAGPDVLFFLALVLERHLL